MIKQFTKDVISLNAFSVALRIFAGLLLAMTNAMIPSLLLSSLLLPLFLSPFCTYKSIFQIQPNNYRKKWRIYFHICYNYRIEACNSPDYSALRPGPEIDLPSKFYGHAANHGIYTASHRAPESAERYRTSKCMKK